MAEKKTFSEPLDLAIQKGYFTVETHAVETSPLVEPTKPTSATKNNTDEKELKTQANPDMASIVRILRTPVGVYAKKSRYLAVLSAAVPILVNSAAGKYLANINGATNYTWGGLITLPVDWTSFKALFSEMFIRDVNFQFFTNNKHSSNVPGGAAATAAGSPGLLNTCAASFVMQQDNSALYSDSANSFSQSCSSSHRKLFNTADDFNWKLRNPTKFSWDGPIGDQTTGNNTMGWCSTASPTSYGGTMQWIFPYASGAAFGIGDLVEGSAVGIVVANMTVAFRQRA